MRPDYALTRKNGNEGGFEAVDQMCQWLETGTPFCHLRFANGEFDSIFGRAGMSGIEHVYVCDGLGGALHNVLLEAASRYPESPGILFGGVWEYDKRYRQYLEACDFLRRIPWAPAQCFVSSIISMNALRFLAILAQRNAPKILVGNAAILPAAKSFGATGVEVPPVNCWTHRQQVWDAVRPMLQPGAVVIWCAGMAAKPMAWTLWENEPQATHVDFGHFFDGAFGVYNRTWLACREQEPNARWRAYEAAYIPVLRGELPMPKVKEISWEIGDSPIV